MKKYSVLSQTPMKWHKFLTYFYVPCSILCTLIALPATIESAELLKFTEYHLIGEIGLVATVVYLFVSICAVVGLAKHRWFGPCFLFAAYITLGIYHLIFLLIGNLWMADQLFLSKSFGQLLASLILLAINIPYYLKRRLLFSDGSAAPKAPSPTADSSVPPASDAQISSAPSYTPSEPPVNAPSLLSAHTATQPHASCPTGYQHSQGRRPPRSFCRSQACHHSPACTVRTSPRGSSCSPESVSPSASQTAKRRGSRRLLRPAHYDWRSGIFCLEYLHTDTAPGGCCP